MIFKYKRWIDYLVHFHASRYYYACHDYLEDWWFELGNTQNHLLMAFIQLAIAQYHYRADNMNGARILLDKAEPIFVANKELIKDYGLDEDVLFSRLEQLISDVKHHRLFKDINLKFADINFENEVNVRALSLGFNMYEASDMGNLHLIHKHKFKHR